jgi:pyruvate dehydrogenase E1 component alpha subunit
MIYICENNLYGMGTSNERSSMNTNYYARGDVIPGVKASGQDVFEVKAVMEFAKKWVTSGKGPMIIEFNTYRYHGHSMSDPGVTYRTREEINEVRKNRDPVEIVRKYILDNKWAGEEELKNIEKKIRSDIEADLEKIKNDEEPTEDDLYRHVGVGHHPIRGVELGLSRW